ncbi:MAG TPA: ABC transporter permease [Chloroflexi bacterium]|nr:ABC transporter permease [Chloroflexota bacterium]
MLKGAFGGWRQIQETVLKAVPLVLVGLGLSVALRCRMWNIGGEGQYFMGALFGGVVALTFPTWPAWALIPTMIIAGVLGGAFWAAIPAWLKIRRGMNEIISTLMLNYIAVLFMEYVARGPLQEPGGYLPESAQFVAAARMPVIYGRLHLGVLLALLLAPFCYLLIWRTPLGFRLRAVGSQPKVARAAGIDPARSIAFALIFSGALAGLAGIIEVSYLHTRLKGAISGGYGYSGVLVALLSRMHPLGVLVVGVFFAALTIGAEAMHVLAQVPAALADAIQALVVLFVLAADALARRE